MREILFRGKTPSGEWVEGDYVTDMFTKTPFINTSRNGYEKVVPETVGQYTGLTDENGKKIFEGDIVRLFGECLEEPIVLFGWNEKRAMFMCYNVRDKGCKFYVDDTDFFLLLGNIYDNPELLKGDNNE